jgi:Ca-activated chloride channel family protein
MNAVDFPSDRGTRLISRLDAAKATVKSFIEGRSDDLIGLVVFANFPDLARPAILDHAFLIETVDAVRPARQVDNGTNIGDAIAVGIDALLAATPTKKVLVLLTDGNNEPAVPRPLDPEQAAILARGLGVTLHTIAIGRIGGSARSVDPRLPRTAKTEGPNVALLERLAELAGGRSFIATDADALEQVFRTIDALEKSPVRGQILTRYDELYGPWAGLALALIVLERFLAQGRLRRLP